VAAELTREAGIIRRALAAVVIGLIRLYQLAVSPWLGPRCRYVPTCSDYAIAAVRRFGPWRGGWLAARRILRCHPWGSTGYDPVPDQPKRDSHS
jgi:putative membrane protein insertion efficiency factor